MIFTSWNFVIFFIFLASFLTIFKSTSHRLTILLLASYIFYGVWNIGYLLLIFVSSFWGWGLGLLMYRSESLAVKKFSVGLSLVLSLGMLGFYKYANFLTENFNSLFSIEPTTSFDILLPVGISFFTFQTMSYTIDLYRGNISPCYSLKKFLLFVAFFPQLVAGPIVRAADFLPQLEKKIIFNKEDIVIGAQIFLGGAIQKMLFADNLSQYVDPVFTDPALYSPITLWITLLAYSLQIFSDFCGYSLMAIGLARGLGFKLPPNFNMPYISLSVTEFWQRWHISLSSWLRDYLYISLGGNRKGEFRIYVNLLITMILGGLWHGASWNFILWGVGHGLALAIHKIWLKYTQGLTIKNLFVYKLLAWSLTFLTVILLWIPFRTYEFSDSIVYFSRLVGNLDSDYNGFDWFHATSILVIAIGISWHIAFILKAKFLFAFPAKSPTSWYFIISILFSFMMFLTLSPQNAAPFIYFQF